MPDDLQFARRFAELDPQGAARVLEELAPTSASAFIDAVPDPQSTRLLGSMLPAHAATCVSYLDAETTARYLAGLDPRTAAQILRCLDEDAATAIVHHLPPGMAARTSLIMNYPRSVVGAWVDPTVLVLPISCTVGDAKARLKNEARLDAARIYVVDEGKALSGFVRIVRLLQADDTSRLSTHMEPPGDTVPAHASLDAVLRSPLWQATDVLAVLDRRGRFLGVVRYAEIRGAEQDRPAEAEAQDGVGPIMELAEYCYLGLAEVLNSSLAIDAGPGTEKRDDPAID